jgi:hypothetical protein
MVVRSGRRSCIDAADQFLKFPEEMHVLAGVSWRARIRSIGRYLELGVPATLLAHREGATGTMRLR